MFEIVIYFFAYRIITLLLIHGFSSRIYYYVRKGFNDTNATLICYTSFSKT